MKEKETAKAEKKTGEALGLCLVLKYILHKIKCPYL
jgi:hypothetical protein